MTGLAVPTVHGWKTIPMQHCPTIERESAGRFTCEEMRPDLVWRRKPEKGYPHPDGRPLLDFLASKEV